MRAILIDWLVQVQIKFRLLQETMYLTVAIIDRFLQVSSTLNGNGSLEYLEIVLYSESCI